VRDAGLRANLFLGPRCRFVKIAGLLKVSLLDYPGRIAASVFLAGCNLDCGYCQNRWMIDAAQVQEAIAVPALFDWLRTRVGLLDGVCVSGGEPTLHADLADLLRGIHAVGLLAKLDTNGTRPAALRALLDEGLVDYVAMDLKAPLDVRYTQLAGRAVELDDLRASMAALRAWDPPAQRYEFRTTAAPGLDADALRDIARLVQACERWLLQPYVPPTRGETAPTGAALSNEQLHALAVELAGALPLVSVRGAE
jgi:pyruvate formate lyase activating enzyme